MYKIFTRSANDFLYSRMSEFLPEDKLVRFTGFNGYEAALEYIIHIIDAGIKAELDYVVNIDEDCYVYRPQAIDDIIEAMSISQTHYAGYCDHGSINHRNFSKTTHNPFFNIFNIKAIVENIEWSDFVSNARRLSAINYFGYEPFDAFFLLLSRKLSPLDLSPIGHEDGITTNTGFALHSWYSRDYGINDFQTNRIDKVYEEAKELCRKL